MDRAKGWALGTLVVSGGLAVVQVFWPRRRGALQGTEGLCQVRLSKREGLKLLEYHGGQGSALYAAGSSAWAGRCFSAKIAVDAARELGDFTMIGKPDPKVQRLRRLLLELAGEKE